MKTRMWPYGARKLGKIVAVQGRNLVVIDKDAEGYVLMDCDTDGIREGDDGTLVFRQGGPTGGHWHFEPDPKGVSR